jgi:hypothetical protein
MSVAGRHGLLNSHFLPSALAIQFAYDALAHGSMPSRIVKCTVTVTEVGFALQKLINRLFGQHDTAMT